VTGRRRNSGVGRLPWVVRQVLFRILPRHRRDDVLGDLEASYRERAARSGRFAARRRLCREVAALLFWRLGSGLRTRPDEDFPERASHAQRDLQAASHSPAGQRLPSERRAHARQTSQAPRGSTLARDLVLDLRYGVRTLARQPGFALTAIAILGLGIGAPVTVLTLVNRIFFERPAEVVEPHRLVTVYRSWGPGQGGGSLGNPDYAYYRDNASTLSGLAAHGGPATVAYSLGDGEADQLVMGFVSDNYFDVLGVRPDRGRFFEPEENVEPGTHPVVVLGHGFWRRALGAREGMIGSTLRLNGQPFTVVGIAPAAFSGLSPLESAPDAWAPIAMYGEISRARDDAWWARHPDFYSNWLSLVGRLAPGVTFEAAEANFAALEKAPEYEGKDPEEGVMVSRQYLYRPAQASALATLSGMLLAVVGIVLAIAVANVAVLLLSRATTRGRELGIRAAIGAGGGRICRQLLAESLLLGLAGGALGVALAYAFAGAAARLLPFRFPGAFVPDPSVLLAAAALSVLTAVAVGLAPALFAIRADVARVIRGIGGGGRSRLRDALVVGQVALSLVLVAAAVLFGRSFWAASSQELGWRTEDRLIVQANLQSHGYDERQGRALIRQGLERIGSLPGVVAVTTTRMIPFQGDWSTDFEPPPELFPDGPVGPVLIGLNTVAPGYFDIMGVEIVQGRPPGREDGEGAEPAVVVNETLARTLWPGQSPLGKTLPHETMGRRRDRDGNVDQRALVVVGVARDVTYYELGESPVAQLYGSVLQVYRPNVHFLVHTDGEPTALAAPVQEALRDIDPDLAFGWVTTMASVFEDQVARYQVSAVLVGLFSAIALVLAATGLYGVVSFLVARRTREIGVRMALGAQRARVAAEVLATSTRLAAAGIVLGIGAAIALRRYTASLLYGIVPQDPWPLAGAALILAAVTLLASLAPARRATRVDPAEAIRRE